MHYRAGEKPCPECRLARNEYDRRRSRIRRQYGHVVEVPERALVVLYLNSTPAAQELLEAFITPAEIDRMVRNYDENKRESA